MTFHRNSPIWLRLTFVALISTCSVALEAADPVLEGGDVGDQAKRISAYFANIPDFEFPCEEADMDFMEAMLPAIPEKEHGQVKYYSKGGRAYAEAKSAVFHARRELKQAYEDRMFSALDTYFAAKEIWGPGTDTDSAVALLETKNQSTAYNYYLYLIYAYHFYYVSSDLQAVVKKHNDYVVQGFDIISLQEQRRLISKALERLQCLREERVKTYKELMTSTIELEKGLANYLNKEFKGQANTYFDTLNADEINAQLQRVNRQIKYLWLVPEFSNQLSYVRSLLRAHDKKMRNTLLLPLLKEAQTQQPHVLPSDSFDADANRQLVRTEIARNRAKLAYVTLLEDEAKIEGSYAVNTSALERIWATWDDVKKKATTTKELGEWVTSSSPTDLAKNKDTAKFMVVALMKQVTGSVIDQLIVTPIKDKAIAELQSTGAISDGWKTSTAADYEKYQQAIGNFFPKLNFLEEWTTSLSYSEGQQYIEWLSELKVSDQGTISGKGQASNVIFQSLIRSHDFNQRTQGGVVFILDALCDDPKDQRSIWYESCRVLYEARLSNGRDRLATARGIESLSDPDKVIDLVDLNMGTFGPIDYWSDVYFEIPSLVKNFFGQNLGDFASQDAYMEKLHSMRPKLIPLITALRLPEVAYVPSRIESLSEEILADHVYLKEHYVDYANAILQVKMAEWQRTQVYHSVAGKWSDESFAMNAKMRPEGEIALVSAQKTEERELLLLNTKLAYLKLEYFAYTGNYRAAATQVVEFAKLATQLKKAQGSDQTVNLRNVELEFLAKATAQETVAIYEGLLNEAISSIVTSAITTRLTERLLSDPKYSDLLEQFQKSQQIDIGEKLFETMVPAHQLFSKQKLLGMVEGVGWSLVKEKLAQEISDQANWLSGYPNLFDQSDFQALTDMVFDAGKDIYDSTHPAFYDTVIGNSIGWWTNKKQVDMLLTEAENARIVLIERMDDSLGQMKQALQDKDWVNMKPADRLKELEAVEDTLRGPMSNFGVQAAMRTYKKAHEALMDEWPTQENRVKNLNNLFSKLHFFQNVEEAATRHLTKIGSAGSSAAAKNPAKLIAQAETWKRILYSKHSQEDLEMLVRAGNDLSIQNRLLTRDCNIEFLRSAFLKSIRAAEAANDEAGVERIREIASEVDDIRIDKINTYLNEFLNGSEGYHNEVAMVIQGGAAKGNPEYQGLFADIDFTLMVKEESDVDQSKLKTDMQSYFREKGFLLASKSEVSSMDSEGFVQKMGRFDSSTAARREIIEDLVEKGVDPTRFYTEGGTLWFINNAAYSGKVLWRNSDTNVDWARVPKEFGFDLAVDMTRYLGFLGSPKYTDTYLEGKDPAYQREVMASALGKTKYFIRLVDAFIMGDEDGNDLYNNRMQERGKNREYTSYHYRIFTDAEALVNLQKSQGKPPSFSDDDLKMIQRIARMKMKGDFSSPWKVFEGEGISESNYVEEAHKTMAWMRDRGPYMIAKLNDDFHSTVVARAKSSDSKTRNELFGSIMRMTSAHANMTFDNPEIAILITAKVENGEPLTIDQQAKLMRDNIRDSLNGTAPGQEINKTYEALDAQNLDLETSKSEVDDAVERERSNLKNVPADELAVFQHEKLFNSVFGYARYVASIIE